jgi:hypothetical protein
MQNSVPSVEVASASIWGRPCYECQIRNGFTSALRLVHSVQVVPSVGYRFSSLADALPVAREQ